MADKLTAEQKAIYLKHGGTCCPFCHSPHIEGDDVEIDNGGAFQPCRCLACGEKWEDQYRLTDVVSECESVVALYCGTEGCVHYGHSFDDGEDTCPMCGVELYAVQNTNAEPVSCGAASCVMLSPSLGIPGAACPNCGGKLFPVHP